MKRKTVNEEILKQVPYDVDEILFIDTETSTTYGETKYGTLWFPQIVTFQIGIYDVKNKTFTKQILFDTDNILSLIENLLQRKEETLVIAFNGMYDLTVMYMNLYMFNHAHEDFESVPAFKFKLLDLMISYDLEIGCLFGKKDKSGGKMDFTISNLPVATMNNTDSFEFLSEYIKNFFREQLGDYVEVSTYRQVCTRETETRKQLLKNPNINEELKTELSKNASGTNARFFFSLGVQIKTVRKLKKLVPMLINQPTSTLNLEDDVGWMNVDMKDEGNFLLEDDEKKTLDAAFENNMRIVKKAVIDRDSNTDNKYLRYVELDIDYLVLLLYALNFPMVDFFHDEILCQSRVRFIGIQVDETKLDNIELGSGETLQEEANKLNGGPINLNSPTQKKKLLQNLLGTELTSVGAKALRRMLTEDELIPKKHEPFIRRLAEHGSKKAYERIVNTLKKAAPANIHPQIFPNSTITWRSASSGSKINFCAIPKKGELRACFKSVIGGDQKTAEVACLAASIDDDYWNELLVSGVDMHGLVLACKRDTLYETIKRAIDAGDKDVKDERGKCKSVIFALFYGGTPEGIAKETGCTVEFITEVRDLLYKLFPKFETFYKEISRFGNFQTMAERRDWNNVRWYVEALPVCLRNIFGLPYFLLVSKVYQLCLVELSTVIDATMDTDDKQTTVIRQKNKGEQTKNWAYKSAMLGSISETQSKSVRRLLDFPMQSAVSLLTKMAKSFIYRMFHLGVQDIHDEILVLEERGLNKQELANMFEVFSNWVCQAIPAFSWKLDIQSKGWKK